ncbi:ethanolamine ammonia lyase-activating protein [Streptomyces sp. SKN60]|uniref:ethanolamine ammonia lyase-activating protein n=1 Tax=Streptomyces sp. SKN60 TaxID=2855506 RepID=UPI002247C630|nr:ethanolamine ammonia lyase-activating protein [Streptomyces sp. SKN60]MCX2180225.1 ethanolamine ammonia lyase-activating protein [Streptomyces sp. SKN60]
MSKDAIVDDTFAAKFATEKDSPYTRWVADEGLDIIAAHYIPDLRTVELKPWERRGGRGVFINHEATRTSNDCYVCEIPAGGALAPQRQLFEEQILVLDGQGSTRVWNDKGDSVTFEWQTGSIFAIPLNAHHQHFNGSGRKAARFVSSTNMPPVINLYGDPEFVFDTPRDFPERFNGEPDYFSPKGEQRGLLLDTNFVADSVSLPLVEAKERGAGGGHIRFTMAKGSMNSHISQFPTATYKKGHRHGPGAHVIILSGEGYSLMWPEGEEPRRYEWGPGSLIVPPNMWFHQHFNTSTEPSRYLAFKHEVVSVRNAQGVPKAWISRRIGGDQIDYADESAFVRDTFREALAKHAMTPRMDAIYASELETLPPLPGAEG